jgi:Tfp pilus assembly protein PilE
LTSSIDTGTDAECGNLTLNNLGTRGRSAGNWTAQECWRK